MSKRIEEHRKLNNSAVHEHITETGHTIDWSSIKIVEKEQHEFKRKVKEAITIRQRNPALNRDAGLDLPSIYNHLLLPN